MFYLWEFIGLLWSLVVISNFQSLVVECWPMLVTYQKILHSSTTIQSQKSKV